ncbi:MAG: hypothetical protein AVDCRST_MAG73-4048 [uncultured Thermomicrobiales bacterium]|uniref:Uncharacterized protein n=1 Tax=uncultured Thermomicrobiales bacterium TaxID=1645740 RepID=A0A6J4V049_9BACT|nr:MAG: hypothetical protein AVDCRST_MAG73-4048 [uncultured Thermomicrobiales bacterium]
MSSKPALGTLRRAAPGVAEPAPEPLPREVAALLRRARWRLRGDRALAGALLGIGVGLVAALIVALLARVRPLLLPDELRVWIAAAVGGGALLGLVAGAVWPAPAATVARRADRALGLRERLGTALELRLIPGGTSAAFVQGQLADTVAAARAARRVPRLGPEIERRPVFGLGGLALLAALAVWAPNPQDDRVRERRADAAAVEAAEAAVDGLAAEVAARTDLDPATKDALAARLADLAAALDPGAMTDEEATTEIAAAESDLRRLEDATVPQRAQALREAAPALQTSGATAEVGNALAAGDLPAAAAALAGLGEQAQSLSAKEQQALAAKLAELAAAQAGTDPGLPAALQAAAGAMAAGDSGAAAGALDQAAGAVSALAADQAAGQAAARAAGGLAAARQGLGESQQAQPPGQGAGQGQGEENGSGQGQGQGQGEGQGQGAGAGAGSGGSTARTNPGGQGGDAQPRLGEAGQAGSREEESVYAPAGNLGQTGAGDPDFVAGQEGQGQEQTGAQTGAGLATDATVPYAAVYGDYARQASRDLEQGVVPPPLQDYVRDYFSALEPAPDDAEEAGE